MRTHRTALTLSLAAAAFLAGHALSHPPAQEGEVVEAGFPVATPGKYHRLLDPLEGTFHGEAVFYTPDGELTSTGTMTNEWILGGHYLKQAWKGDFMGAPFEGLGFLAYDDRTGAYQTVWMDGMSNHISFETGGEISKDGMVITVPGNEFNPELGGEVAFEDVTTIHDRDHHVFERHYLDANGAKTPGMRITYKRK